MKNAKRVAASALSAALIAAGVGAVPATARDKNCSDFSTQHKAQRWFKKHGGSKKNNVAGLDADHDGIACEDLP
jgi:hypothetical protein